MDVYHPVFYFLLVKNGSLCLHRRFNQAWILIFIAEWQVCNDASTIWIPDAVLLQRTCRCSQGFIEWHYEVGQNSKQEKSQWQMLARTASDTVNYANELIREAERADKTKQPLFNHSWGLLELWSQIYNACCSIHILCVCVCMCDGTTQHKHHLKECLVSLWWQWWSWKDRW